MYGVGRDRGAGGIGCGGRGTGWEGIRVWERGGKG